MSTMAEDAAIPVDDQSRSFRQIVDSFPELLHTARPDGYLDFFNRTWLDFTGVPLERLMGWGWTCRIHPDDVEAFVQKMRESFAKGKPFEETSRLRRADGVYRWMLHRTLPRFDRGGKLVKWHGSSIDIDDRKRAEEQLIKSALESQRSSAYLAEAQRLSHTGSFGWNPDTGEIVWSDETYRIFEYDRARNPTLDMILERLHPQDRACFQQILDRASQTGTNFEHEYRLLLVDGRVKHLHAIAHASKDASGCREFIGAVTDITEEKRAEETHRNSERELRQILDLVPQQVRVYGPGGERLYANCIALDYYGVSLEDWRQTPGHAFRSSLFVHPDDQDRAARDFDANSSSGSAYESEVRVRGADGNYRWFLVRHNPLHDEQRQVMRWYVGLTDIEDRKQAEEMLRRSQFYLAEGERLGQTGSWALNPSGFFEYWSQGLFQIYGLDPQKGAPTLEQYLATIHPQDRDFMAETVKRMCEQSSGCDVKKRIIRADGAVRYVRCVGIPVLDNGVLRRFLGTAMDVTEQEQLTQELQRREAYLAEAQKLSHAGSFGWKPGSGEYVFSEEAYCIFEHDPAEKVTLDRIIERVHPDDRALALETAERASISGGTIDLTYRLLFADGRVKHLHVLAKPLRSACDELEFVGAVIDITAAKQAEETLRNSERELRTLIDIMPAYVGTALPDGTADFFSQRWLSYFGQTREEAMGWGWAGVVHPDDVHRVLANWRAGLASGEPVEQELRCRRADGVYRWFLNRNLPLRDDEEKIVKWYGILFDIHALKETESALQTREHELLGIVETIPSLLWSASPAFVPTHMSKRLLEYFGAPFEEFVNGGWQSFIHPDDLTDTAKAISRAVDAGESFSVMHRLRRADGEYRWHHARGEPLLDPDGRIIQWYGLSVDIDDRKRGEDHLRDTRVKLAKASRLATVAELAGSIAHELNQPLTSILANAQAAKKWLNAAPSNMTEVNSSIERTIRDARAADETMQHIRALFKQESFDKKDVKIPDILNEVVRIVQEDPKKRAVPVECHLEQSLPAVSVDQIQIQQVFINLIVNAIEASEGQKAPPQVILQAAVTDSDRMLVQVIDNGPGVDDPERIFDAFMTTKEKGMGIGLAVSRTIVEAHGGRLWAENNKAGGAIFNVTLPMGHAG